MEEEKKEEVQEEVEQEQEQEKSLDKMTAKELREIAMEIPGVTGVHAMKKEQLLEIIKEEKGIKDEEPVIKKKKTSKKEVEKGELKRKIVSLKKEKAEARGARDKKKVDILRRRINRLKKQTRKVA